MRSSQSHPLRRSSSRRFISLEQRSYHRAHRRPLLFLFSLYSQPPAFCAHHRRFRPERASVILFLLLFRFVLCSGSRCLCFFVRCGSFPRILETRPLTKKKTVEGGILTTKMKLPALLPTSGACCCFTYHKIIQKTLKTLSSGDYDFSFA
jgi:hypothetical protein